MRFWSWAVGLMLAAANPAFAETITILHTNDTHNHLVPFDAREGKNLGGMARRARFFAEERQKGPTLVLDAGDVFQGTPLYTFFKGEVDYKAMSLADYDAGCLGNHDLDDGWDNLKKQLAQADFPVLSANVVAQNGQPILPASATFQVGGVKVGVIGLMGENAWRAIATRHRAPLKFLDPLSSAKPHIDRLRPQVDLLVLVTHNGHQEDLDWAKQLSQVDLIVGGHSHTKVDQPVVVPNGNPNGIKGTLVVQAYQWGLFVGRLRLDVEKGRLMGYRGELVAINDQLAVNKDNPIDRYILPFEQQIAAKMNEVIGTSDASMPIAGKYGGEIALGNLLTDILRTTTGSDVAILNSGGIRTDLPQGPVTLGKVYEILPFDNTVVTLELPGHELARIGRVVADKIRNKQSGTLQFSGLQLKIKGDTASVFINGRPVDPKRRYKVATINYLLDDNEGPYFGQAERIEDSGAFIRDVVISHIRKVQRLSMPGMGRIVVE